MRRSRCALPVSEQAAEWLVALDDGALDAVARREFLAWLKQSPDHIREFLQLSALHVELAQNPYLEQEVETLVAAARSDAIDLQAETELRIEAPSKRPATRRWSFAAAMLLGLMLVSGY